MYGIDLDRFLAPRLQTMRIILLALVLGCVFFLIVVLILRASNNLANDTAPMMTAMAFVFGAVSWVLSVVIPRRVAALWRKQIARGVAPSGQSSPANPVAGEQRSGMEDARSLCVLYQSQMIIGAAMLEGAIFFNLIAYMMEGDPFSLGVALALLLALIWRIPTRNGVENFLVEQGELLQQERQTV
jgi:hypothetical protein